jgi:hypothetical protein
MKLNMVLTILSVFLNLSPDYIGHCLLRTEKNDIFVPVYTSSSDTVAIAYIVNDGYYEDYPDLYIRAKKANRVLVDVEYMVWGDDRIHNDICGWIDIRFLGTYLDEGNDVKKIYMAPDRDAAVAYEIRGYDSNFYGGKYIVTDVWDYWLKIVNPLNPNLVGWLPPEYSITTNP